MWVISLPHWWEFVLRAAIVYVFLLIALRLTGRRQVGQLAPFDLVLLLILSNAVQNSMNGGDNTITGGVLLSATLLIMNWCMAWLTVRYPQLENVIEGKPIILVHDGHIDHVALRKAQMTPHELETAIRSAGVPGPHEARLAILESNGHITVLPMKAMTP
jgi:uncharacterized membrane protein YcaP (DUF421 family)